MEFSLNTPKRLFSSLLLLSLCLLLNACTTVYKQTGNILIGYAEDEGLPYMLASDDVALSCSMIESFTPFLLSFSRVNTSPEQLAVLFYLVAGHCTESKASEEELRYLRAIHAKNATEAQDARIAQQRYLSQAAKRQLKGYRHLAPAYSEPGAECPSFDGDNDEFYWLAGLISGLQALSNDIASSGNAKVPLNMAAKIGRAASCLDNEKWWGVPDAMQAAIWIMIPGNTPADKNPGQILDDSMKLGTQQGIRLPHVLAAQVYLGLGETEKVKQIIRDHRSSTTQVAGNQDYAILNQISVLLIQQFSDRLWTEATGKRTPLGKLGAFWDDPDKKVDIIEIDDIL